ncbi:50S RIBOSOMAL PROTEIN L3 [Mycoplasmopsis pulmonis]|uniref:Large ribosomal subunit protein uL3 n=1 Tax=Mycoplasmopsis pulmonis (strain UAB CTIP) TaxID=272635 RepID=RL3_MYCPU|nr:50S ribosomal protein L3 [Mycoplasmopsis pulmonis]Q98PY0.1 RecName: Full=Large ribosomal subunit protein uL3; AltName: Full=50S ribosomal protein L3 [Mycoplasmopsis pulmonis UAB CTIP]MDZ7293609.1 50S ribosomal protein L3 [Mycoplasmopsis pulmonis]CAC13762.1 50S RIBOSOMAL PROTEIN L3 [Mycoplasmopsis pulmonis]VEU68351.1 50S ribosomal protein L3 [Mycoplasmopsis pulmonis]
MKGILGRKVGMTQIFSDNGIVIPVTLIEVKPNIVSNVLTDEKNGYKAIQLSLEDKKKSRQRKPEIGHFAKANTTPKRFVKEIRDMQGFELGSNVDVSIFTPGEFVDVTGISKGKGFAGTIKRHNQKIGPKSHGGGGGSKPVRQTGSLGDISGNKVVKGMTMPGHLGHEQVTIQNLEVIMTDVKNNILLVKGAVPGPKKGFVVIKECAKKIPSKEAVKLVDLEIVAKKNHLFEISKKYNINLKNDMSIEEMESLIEKAKEEQEGKGE